LIWRTAREGKQRIEYGKVLAEKVGEIERVKAIDEFDDLQKKLFSEIQSQRKSRREIKEGEEIKVTEMRSTERVVQLDVFK